jgi:hypothetical protein
MTLDLGSTPRPLHVHLVVPAAAAQDRVRVEVTTTTWRDTFRNREVGLHVGAQWVLAQRLAGLPAIEAAIARIRAQRQAEDLLEGWWHGIQALYLLPHRTLPAAVAVSPGDEDHLGPGWFGREDWGQSGMMRWTGGRAEVYLGHNGRATRVRVRAYAGEALLGPVSGQLVVERVESEGHATPAGQAPFAIAPDTWAELAAPLAAPAGLVRLTIHADSLRIPRERVPGSGDGRGLGLAVKRIWLAR